ncbi:MAG: protein tyrosine phosphatase [Burkholderiales bacterium]|jgi:protein-tyrosine phosphatase|nr:protein tyrosine phosphatase [Burkholderiales bacterium]
MLKVLFVCLGNICRSPLAHGILDNFVKENGYVDKIKVSSAGTSAFHVGSRPDPRTIDVCKKHGITLNSTARQFVANDFWEYDFILVMDHLNYADVLHLCENKEHRAKVLMLRSFDPEAHGMFDVPDPYYGGVNGFEEVFAMCNRSIQGFIAFLQSQSILPN